jgi:hypothetical protein
MTTISKADSKAYNFVHETGQFSSFFGKSPRSQYKMTNRGYPIFLNRYIDNKNVDISTFFKC